jgi:hypothetical protein
VSEIPRVIVIDTTNVADRDLPSLYGRVAQQVHQSTGELERLWALRLRSSRRRSAQDGSFSCHETSEKARFIQHLEEVLFDSAFNRRSRICSRLEQMASHLAELDNVEQAMASCNLDKVIRLSQEFNALAASAVRAFSKARQAHVRDRDVLVRRTATNLEGALRFVPGRSVESVRLVTCSVTPRSLPEQAAAVLRYQLDGNLYGIACLESGLVQREWMELIETFRQSTEACINDLRSRTNDLLDVQLPSVHVNPPDPPEPLSAWLFRDMSEFPAPVLNPPTLMWRLFGPGLQRRHILAEIMKLADQQIRRATKQCRDQLERYGEEEFERVASSMHDQLDRVLAGMGRAEGLLRSADDDRELVTDRKTTGVACKAARRCGAGH